MNVSGNTTNSYNIWYTTFVESDESPRILQWLSPLEPQVRHHNGRLSRVEGVGDWLLHTNEFEKWHTSEDGAVNPVLFCYGDPGVGKTYMSSLVIDALCDLAVWHDVCIACFYCDFHTRNEQSATTVLGALLKQVVSGIEQIPSEIKSAFESARRQADGRALRLPQILAMLVKLLSYRTRGFIFIDALDEFPAKNRPELWESLQNIVRECPNTRLFLTGSPDILDEVEIYFAEGAVMVHIKPSEGDITRYLEFRLDQDTDPDCMDDHLREEIITFPLTTFPKMPVLLLVSLIVDATLAQPTVHQRRQTLHKMTNGLDLQEAYGATLDRIKTQKGSKARLGMETLMWISRSERPLEVQELCHALAVEAGTTDLNVDNVPSIKTLLGCTLGLITVDQQSTVRLIHFTLQEYLGTHANLFITPHAMMAEICLTYLNFQSVCQLRTIPETTPFLHYASCYWGYHARTEATEGVKGLAKRLLQHYPDHISAHLLLREENSWTLGGFTGLHCIAYLGIAEIAVVMVEMKEWDLNGRDSTGATPLMWAARYKNYAVAKVLLVQEDILPNLSDKNGLTPLSWAARSGDEALVELLVEREDVNPGSSDNHGRTPLLWAARSGHERIVELLLEREDLDPNASDNSGRAALAFAAEEGHEGVVRSLLEREDINPDLPDNNGRTPISFAASCRADGVVRLLLERVKVNPASSNNNGRTPLSFAASSGNEGAMRLLLKQRGVNPDSLDSYGQTPLLWASKSGHEGIVGLLLEQKEVNPSVSDIYNQTPLLMAAWSGHVGIVKRLLERDDLNPDSSNKNGRTALSFAAGAGYEAIVKLILQHDCVNPNSSDNNGRTPLSWAAKKGQEGVVKQLLEYEDVNPDSSDKAGRTPRSLAAMRGHEGVVKLLSPPKQLTPEPTQTGEQTTQTSIATAGSSSSSFPEIISSPPESRREEEDEGTIRPEITDETTDAISLLPLHPVESAPNPPDALPPPTILTTPTTAFWVSCGVFLLSVVAITQFQAGRKHNPLGLLKR